MKITLWTIGATNEVYLKEGIAIYQNRLKHYTNFKIEDFKIKVPKSAEAKTVKKVEAEFISKKLQPSDVLILLDEKGKSYSSREFAAFIEKKQVAGTRHLIFLIGGAFGFDDAIYKRANGKLSLSAMTFSHQMIRLFFCEQLYRGFTILNNEPYHND